MNYFKNDGRSIVWLDDDGWVYKQQMKTLCDNEMFAYDTLFEQGLTVYAERVKLEQIRMQYVRPEVVTDVDYWMSHYHVVLDVLKFAGIRHGDLTEYSVLVRKNQPVLIDWAESRFWNDPRPDKRPEGDAYWLERTMKRIAGITEE